MSRKLVAVGTDRLRSMLAAIAAPAPRMGSPTSSPLEVGSGPLRTAAGAEPFVEATAGDGAGVATAGVIDGL